MSENTITIKRDTTEIIDLTLLDDDGIPYDLTGFEVTFYVKDDISKPDSQAVITKRNTLAGGGDVEITVIDAVNGQIRVYLLPDDTKDLNGNFFAYSVFIKLTSEQYYPFLNQPLIVEDDVIYEYQGWSVDKRKISYYAFNGNGSRYAEVPDHICETAVHNMCAELLNYGTTCEAVDKSDPYLNNAIVYYAVCEMKSSGAISETTGDVLKESIGDKSVWYGQEQRSNITKIPMPHNVCDKAVWYVGQYAKSKNLTAKKVQIVIKNYRSNVFGGIYNKYTEDYKYGEP